MLAQRIFSHVVFFNLSYDGGFTDLSFDWGRGAQSTPPPLFFCENYRKSNKIMHCVKKNYLIGSFKDKAIFHVILEIDR